MDTRGFAHYQLGNYPAAIASFGQAVTLFETACDRCKPSETLIRPGKTHRAADDIEMARHALEEAEAILNELDHPDTQMVRTMLLELDT